MRWPWKRDETSDKDVDVLVTEANEDSPTGPFRMVVEDVFTITGRGSVATGRIEQGVVRVGQQVTISRAGTPLETTTITGVEMFRKVLDSAGVGDNVGLLMKAGTNLMRGDVIG